MNELHLLVERAQNGDRTAYNHLIQRFQKMAVAYSYAKLGDRSLAEDVAQEAFLYGYRTLDQLREPAAFPGWYSAGDEDEVRLDVPQLLLVYGADRTLCDSVRQLTPLEWAERMYMDDEKARTAVAKLLRGYGS